jgi:hypothetical protein
MAYLVEQSCESWPQRGFVSEGVALQFVRPQYSVIVCCLSGRGPRRSFDLHAKVNKLDP